LPCYSASLGRQNIYYSVQFSVKQVPLQKRSRTPCNSAGCSFFRTSRQDLSESPTNPARTGFGSGRAKTRRTRRGCATGPLLRQPRRQTIVAERGASFGGALTGPTQGSAPCRKPGLSPRSPSRCHLSRSAARHSKRGRQSAHPLTRGELNSSCLGTATRRFQHTSQSLQPFRLPTRGVVRQDHQPFP